MDLTSLAILLFGILIGIVLTLGYITYVNRGDVPTAKTPRSSPSPTRELHLTEFANLSIPDAPVQSPQNAAWNSLTPREREVAVLVAKGNSNQETARAMKISPRTVDSYLRSVYRKLQLRSRTELANFVNTLK